MNAITQHALDALRAGDRHAIARTISAVENDDTRAGAIARAIASHLGRAHVIGVTGAPGAGKSTLVNALLGELIARGQRIAVVAVDPSSPITGGAVLGDRIRMGQYGANDDVFIRSVSSRGQPGGLSRTTGRIVDVLDAAGYDIVIVETVGAGQSDVAIAEVADTRIVVCPPGLGDDVQAIKAGILEIADIFVVNKADLPGTESIVRDLRDMLRLRSRAAAQVPVLKTVATRGEGLAAVVDAALAHAGAAGRGHRLATRSRSGTDPRHTPQAPEAHDRHAASASHATGRAHAHAGPAEREIEAVERIPRLAARDPFVAGLGIRVIEGGAGHAAVALTLTDTHLNFNGSCHGGVIFALADTAFGLASNSRGLVAVGIDVHIAYHVAAKPGDTLTAIAVEISRTRKLAVYRVDVARGDGTPIASFTGTVYLTGQPNEPHAAAT